MTGALRIAWYERGWRTQFASLLMGAIATVVAILVAYRSPDPSLAGPFAAAAIAGIAVWMVSTARTYLTLGVLMLYLGCVDGVIKLMTNSSAATLGRDLLLYAIVVGLIGKRLLRKEPFVYPPLTGWIVAYVVVIAVQVFNPGDVSFSHSVASMRPHLEFVPLFFLGYSMMRTRRRIKGFLLLMLVIGAANGVVGLVQFSMSPSQLASWGPGYASRLNGTDGLAPRDFTDSAGQSRVRPFALGSDIGFGGAVGVLAAPAMLVLLSLKGTRRMKIAVGAMSIWVVLAVVTSQARTNIIACVVGLVAYSLLATSSRRVFRIVLGMGVGALIGYAAVSVLAASSSSHLFSRYSSITPSKVFSTAYNYRSGNLAQVPQDIAQYPLGAGIGKTGPAGNSAGGTGYNESAENEASYLVLELGVPGFLLMMAFQLRFLALSWKLRRVKDLELRLLLAGVAAPLFALFAAGFAGIVTATTPGGPYLWFASGILTYWLVSARKRTENEPSAVA